MENQTIRFEQVNDTHIEAIQQLYQKVYNRPISAETLRNKYDSFTEVKEWIACIAFADDEPVAFSGIVVIPAIYDGQRVLSGQIADSMTVPDFRAKGLFTSIINRCIELLRKNGVQFVWGYANQNSEVAVLKKLDFVYNQRFTAFLLNNGDSVFNKIRTKLNPSKAQKRVQRILARFNQTELGSSSLASKYDRIQIDKSPEYLSYKFKNGSKVYSIEGVKFWINVKRHLLIGDIEYEHRAELEKAMKTLLELITKYKLGGVHFHAIEPSEVGEVMKSYGAITIQSWSLCYRNISCEFPLEKLGFTFADIDTF